jgi:hypothetical protein
MQQHTVMTGAAVLEPAIARLLCPTQNQLDRSSDAHTDTQDLSSRAEEQLELKIYQVQHARHDQMIS